MGSYWVDADQSPSGSWEINACIYTNATSPVTVPVFGNLLLQSIAQTVTEDENLKLDFTYRSFDSTVKQTSRVNVNPSIALISMTSMMAFFIDIYLVSDNLLQAFNGYYTMILMRGATHSAIVLPRILIEFAIYFVFFEILAVLNMIYGVDTSGWQLLGFVWCLAQTAYSTLFNAL